MIWAPESASNFSPLVDQIAFYMVWISIVLVFMVFGLITYFCVKYRKGSLSPRPPRQSRLKPQMAEFGLVFFIFVFAMSFFIWSGHLYYHMYLPAKGATEVFVIGKQWMWIFHNPQGEDQINTLTLPLGKPVRLIMTSQDVIHSFYVPSFRIKQDLVPGQYTSLWFTPTKLGTFPILCAQFCGLDHAKMRGAIEVLSPEDYDKNILQKGSVSSLAEMGKKLFTDKSCIACHEGPVPMGPRLENIMGKKVELTDGRQVVVDENYLRRSILNPQADIVKGYQAIMPSFQGQLTEQELAALISYIKTKKREPPP